MQNTCTKYAEMCKSYAQIAQNMHQICRKYAQNVPLHRLQHTNLL